MLYGDGELEFNNIWGTVIKSWQVKLLVSFFVTVFTFLAGGVEASFIALWVLVSVDNITKRASV